MATRMQQRRGTAAQWISTNSGNGPVLNSGEIGYESDTNKFKIGDGVNHWLSLPYFVDLNTTIAGAPGLLNSLDEIAAAIGDDPAFFTTVATNLSNHQADTTAIHGIADTSLLVTTTGTQTLTNKTITTPAGLVKGDVGLSNVDNTTDANKPVSTATQTALDLKAPLASPALTGTPTAPTATAGTNSTQVATTAYADAAVAALVDAAPGTLNTLNEIAAAINDDASYAATITTALGLKAPLESPALTGTPTAPTAAADTSTTQVATTAFAKAEADAAQSAAEATASGALSAHQSDTTSIHGIPDTSVLETQQGAQTRVDAAVSTHNSDTTGVHGIADTALLETTSGAQSKADTAVSTHNSDTTDVHGIADTALLATKSYADSAVSTHNSDTTNVHGIADIAALATQQYVLDQISNSTGDYPDLAGAGLDWNAVTSAFDIDSTVATLTGTQTLTNKTITSPSGLVKADVGLGNVDNTSDANKPISTATQTALDLKANASAIAELAQDAVDTAIVAGVGLDKTYDDVANTITLDIDSTVATKTYADTAVSTHNSDTTDVHGIADTALLATKSYADTAVSTHNSDTTDVHGIADTALLATKSYADSAVSTHNSDTTNVHGIENTANLATKQYSAGLLLNATKTNITITGDVDGLTITAENGVADSNTDFLTEGTNNLYFTTERAQDAIGNSVGTGLSYNDATGAVSVDTAVIQARVTNITDTEIGYLDGLSSSIQTQIDTKAALVSPTFTGTVSGITKSMVGLANVDDTTDANKPVSTAGQTALDLKAPLASPTFTGTVSGITKTMVGLGSVDNTTDAAKPVSTATQTALDAKLALAGGTMTGALTLSGAPTSDLHAATKLYVDNVTAGLNFHEAVHAASITNLAVIYNNGTSGVGATLTADTNRAFSTLDGESVVVGQRVLIKNQTDAKQNGIYTLTTNGSVSVPWVLTRATDADNNPAGEMKNGDFTFVQAGTVNASIGFINNSATNPIVIGTDNISYTEFNAGKTVVVGDGLTEATPGVLSIASGAITSAMIADGTIVDADVNASAAIAQSKISGLTAALGDKAPLASPTFTGTATIPTLTLTNPLSAANGGTGLSSLGTGVATFLGTPSSANLAAMITDEIGTGNIVLSEIATSSQTASYTLVAGDRGKLVEMNVGSANNLTVPLDSSVNFPTGTQIDILQVGSGQTTVVATGGVTINGTPGLKIRAQWGGATLIKRAADTWVLIGDLTA